MKWEAPISRSDNVTKTMQAESHRLKTNQILPRGEQAEVQFNTD